jgi:bifunctional non-homologous end joining protein LigD
MIMRTIKLNGHMIELTHKDKIYFPPAITKGMLLEYYARIAPILIPHIHDRPLTLQRFPEGITGTWFYQKDAPEYFPDWIETRMIRSKDGKSVSYVVCQDVATLVYIANQSCITPHRWLSTISKLNYPDLLIFDLDPAHEKKFDFNRIKQTALLLKQVLEVCGLDSWLMTTGSRGLHVCCPINPIQTFDTIRAFARDIATYVVTRDPDHLTLESHTEKRGGKILIDVMRNSFGATAVAPYAVRALPGAPIATPLKWSELSRLTSSQAYTIKTIFQRLARRTDPWHDIHEHAQKITAAHITFAKQLTDVEQ